MHTFDFANNKLEKKKIEFASKRNAEGCVPYHDEDGIRTSLHLSFAVVAIIATKRA